MGDNDLKVENDQHHKQIIDEAKNYGLMIKNTAQSNMALYPPGMMYAQMAPGPMMYPGQMGQLRMPPGFVIRQGMPQPVRANQQPQQFGFGDPFGGDSTNKFASTKSEEDNE